jgi:hypothetical protein
MTRPIALVPLRCVRCETPVTARPDEVAWVCSQCGQGLLLDEERGLSALEVHFAAGIAAGTRGYPFWVAEGRVTIHRATYRSSGKARQESQRQWGAPRRFFLPAFDCPLDAAISTGTSMLLNPPDLQAGPPVDFAAATLSPQDMPALAEFIVVALEAERRDKIKQIDLSLDLDEPELWVLPLSAG